MTMAELVPGVGQFKIQLTGGPWDGRVLTSDGWPGPTICTPVPQPADGTPETWQPLPVARYSYTGSVRDDGTRVYQYNGQS